MAKSTNLAIVAEQLDLGRAYMRSAGPIRNYKDLPWEQQRGILLSYLELAKQDLKHARRLVFQNKIPLNLLDL